MCTDKHPHVEYRCKYITVWCDMATKTDKIMSKYTAPDGGVVFAPIVKEHACIRRRHDAVRVATTAANCPYDASKVGTIPCRCSNKCGLKTRCHKCHHRIFFGASKTVLLGCFIPLRLQQEIAPFLAKLHPDKQIVSIVVDLTEDGEESMLGEIETLLAIDKIDPGGVFTSKLIFERKLPFDENDMSLEMVNNNLTMQEQVNPTTKKEQQFHNHVRRWIRTQSNLYCIYMVYAGNHMGYNLPPHTGRTTVYTAYKNLLLNYQTLSKKGICHLDMHRENVTWEIDSKGHLDFKIIDFGYNRVYTDENRSQMDVTKHFLKVCNVVKDDSLRVFHPVEYPMFHLCVSLLLHPIFVPEKTWDRRKHQAKVKLMLKFTQQTTEKQLVACKWTAAHYKRALPNSAEELFGLWCNIWKTYANIEDILLSKWQRVCKIVDKEIDKVYFESSGGCINITRYPRGLAETSYNFTYTSYYMDLFEVFRGRFYECDARHLHVIHAEFDIFSMGMMMLEQFTDTDTAWKHVIKTYLLTNTYNKTTRRKISETTLAIQQLTALQFMKI